MTVRMVNEKHSRNSDRWPARPYSSSSAGSGVMLRHRVAAAACAFYTAYCTPEGAAERPWFSAQPLPKFQWFYKRFFSSMFFYNCGLPFSQRKLLSYHV